MMPVITTSDFRHVRAFTICGCDRASPPAADPVAAAHAICGHLLRMAVDQVMLSAALGEDMEREAFAHSR